MLHGFQQYLVDKGFKRACTIPYNKKETEDYSNIFLSSYGPLFYSFQKESHSCWYGLAELHKGPVLNLGNEKMLMLNNPGNYRTREDGYRILFKMWHEDKFDLIYDAFTSDNKVFKVNCQDEENISISIVDKSEIPRL